LSPKEEYSPQQQDLKARVMAVALSGKFKSFYADKKAPPLEEEKKPEPDTDKPASEKANKNKTTTTTIKEATKPAQQPEIIKESTDTKMIVVGNARFITENFPAEFDGNRIFFLNVIDWFTIGDYLIGIRSRESTDRPLRVIPDQARAAIRIINILGVSILLAGFGLLRLYARRRRKRLGITGI
jgi:ABC-2 type transport system permease protein